MMYHYQDLAEQVTSPMSLIQLMLSIEGLSVHRGDVQIRVPPFPVSAAADRGERQQHEGGADAVQGSGYRCRHYG